MLPVKLGASKTWREGQGFAASALVDLPGGDFELRYTASRGPLSANPEPFLAASLIPAMKLGASLHLSGPLSPRLSGSLEEIQQILHAWYPELQPIEVRAPSGSIAAAGPGRGVACFFSGGVDSFYTVLKHIDEIDQLIFVHGLDIQWTDRQVLSRIATFINAAAEELRKPLIEIESNFQELTDPFVHLSVSHGAAMAGIALLFSRLFGKVYLPASFTYARLMPYGSHPLLDPLWSTEAVEIVHDGAEASRIDKAALLATSKTALKYLRVCWNPAEAHSRGAYNCGQCEKCLRTKINFYLAGALDRCATLEHGLDLRAVAHLEIREDVRHHYLDSLQAAESAGTDPALIQALREALGNRVAQELAPRASAEQRDVLIQGLERENAALKAQVQALHDSRSWRITRPLRAFTDALRRLRSSAG